jgi:hypothetical protein
MMRIFLAAALSVLAACATTADPSPAFHCSAAQQMCVAGTKTCASINVVEVCVVSPINGCALPQQTTCPSGQTCQKGTCAGACADECQDGDAQCDGSGVQTCGTSSDGCAHWGATMACDLGQKCSGGACSVGGGNFAITFQSGVIPATDASGSSWDLLGNAPDPKVAVYVNGTKKSVTKAQSDTLKPIWNQTLDVALQNGDELKFVALDEDTSFDDTIDQVTFKSWETLLSNGGQHSGALYTGSKVTLKWVIAPL